MKPRQPSRPAGRERCQVRRNPRTPNDVNRPLRQTRSRPEIGDRTPHEGRTPCLQGLQRNLSTRRTLRVFRVLRPARGRLHRARCAASPRERIEQGPRTLWRYADFLPVAPPAVGLPVGLSPLIRAETCSRELGLECDLYVKTETSNPTHSFKDRVVGDRGREGGRAGFEALACASTGNLAGADRGGRGGAGPAVLHLRPEQPRAREDRRGLCLRRHGVCGRRLLRRRQPALLRARLRAAVGVRQCQHAGLLRRGLQDDRARNRRAARLAGARPGGRADRLRVALHQDPGAASRRVARPG